MTTVNNLSKHRVQSLLKLLPVHASNVSVILPQSLQHGVSPPGLRNTIQTLFEARFKQSLNDLGQKASALSAAATNLSPAHPGFNERSAKSSKPEIASIEATAGSGVGSASLQVFELAEAQENLGAPLLKNAENSFDSGRQFFDFVQEGKSSRLSIFVDPKDTQGSVLEKLAKAINNSGRGVDASILISEDGQKAQLSIQAHETGEKAAFDLKDRLGTVIEKSGANKALSPGKNAHFSLNGQESESDSNRFSIDSGRIHIALKGELGTSNISVTQEGPALKTMITDFVDKVNQFRQQIGKSSAVLNAEIAKTFDHQLSIIRESLDEIGLKVNMGVVLGDLSSKSEAISIDEDALNAAIEKAPSKFEEILAGPGGLASRMGSIADAVQGSSTLELLSQSQHILSPLGPGSGRDSVTGILLSSLS